MKTDISNAYGATADICEFTRGQIHVLHTEIFTLARKLLSDFLLNCTSVVLLIQTPLLKQFKATICNYGELRK